MLQFFPAARAVVLLLAYAGSAAPVRSSDRCFNYERSRFWGSFLIYFTNFISLIIKMKYTSTMNCDEKKNTILYFRSPETNGKIFFFIIS